MKLTTIIGRDQRPRQHLVDVTPEDFLALAREAPKVLVDPSLRTLLFVRPARTGTSYTHLMRDGKAVEYLDLQPDTVTFLTAAAHLGGIDYRRQRAFGTWLKEIERVFGTEPAQYQPHIEDATVRAFTNWLKAEVSEGQRVLSNLQRLENVAPYLQLDLGTLRAERDRLHAQLIAWQDADREYDFARRKAGVV